MAGKRRGSFGSGMTLLPGGQQQQADSKYDEAEFIVGGRGTGPGETEREWFKIHEGYVAEAAKLLASGLFPYQSLTDLYRHAVVRHIDWLLSLEPQLLEGSVLHQLHQINEIVAKEQFELRYVKLIDSIASTINQIIELPSGRTEVAGMLRRIERRIQKMRPSFYKSYFEKMFVDRFGVYLPKLALLDIETTSSEEGMTEEQMEAMMVGGMEAAGGPSGQYEEPNLDEADYGPGEDYDDEQAHEEPEFEEQPE